VIRICTECGALLLEDADNCPFCDAPLAETAENLEPLAVGVAPSLHVASSARAETARRADASALVDVFAVASGRAEASARADASAHSASAIHTSSTNFASPAKVTSSTHATSPAHAASAQFASPARATSPRQSLTDNQSVEPEWRREVSRRLEDYRARRGYLRPDDSQSGLPFSRQSRIAEEEAAQERQREAERLREAERQRLAERQRIRLAQRKTERVEINVQPELDFSSAAHERAHPQTALVPVASLIERRKAGFLDAIFLGLTYAGFLGLFRSLGGQVVVEKADAVVYLAAFFLFYVLYFSLFTTCAEATPGMQLLCLTTVRLDGTVPDTRQLLWRSFGYLLAGATLMLGFVWALWDEDHFTWQDRISQTYVTGAMPLMEQDALEVPAGRRSFARR
jgi:uncharacterized RDD family membrane protein YckC/RNA polymerase subunit RPABC4/transcription elongation factor Spt4